MDIQEYFDALKKVMPNVMDRVNPPATAKQLQKLKALYDFEIDPLYIDFLKVCNGEKDVLMMGFGNWIQDIDRACCYHSTEWMNWHSIADNPHLCKDQYYGNKRVPFMEDGGGSQWFLDYDPALDGKMGQVICVFRDQPEIVFNCFESFEELLQTAISEINQGKVLNQDPMGSFNFGENNIGIGYNYYVNKSATYHKNKIIIPDNFFTNLTPEWLWAVSEAPHNPIINRSGITAKPQEALSVKEIVIRDAKMMDTFVETMQYLPNVQFLSIYNVATLTDEHYAIIKKLRLHALKIECPVKNIATLCDADSLRNLSLARMYDADINEIAIYKNLIKLDIQRKKDEPSLAFLEQMNRVEELQLWHEESTIVKKENVESIEKMKNLKTVTGFNTKNSNFENITMRTENNFFSMFIEFAGHVR